MPTAATGLRHQEDREELLGLFREAQRAGEEEQQQLDGDLAAIDGDEDSDSDSYFDDDDEGHTSIFF